MDPIFEMEVKFFEGTAKFSQKVKLTGGDYLITGYLEFGACNDQNCLPPTSVDFSYKGTVAAAASATAAPAKTEEAAAPAESTETVDSTAAVTPPPQP